MKNLDQEILRVFNLMKIKNNKSKPITEVYDEFGAPKPAGTSSSVNSGPVVSNDDGSVLWDSIKKMGAVKSLPREWQSYPCVLMSGGVMKDIIDPVFSAKIKVFVIGDTTFYNNGNYKIKGNENNGKYSCNGNSIVYNTKPAVAKSTSTSTSSTKSTKKKNVDYLKSEQCAMACNDRYPYYSVICDGGKWKSTLKSWIAEKGGGENKETYRALRTSWCTGWRPGQTQQTTTDFVAPVFTTTTTVLPQNFGSDAIL